jgi:hypothetical protein
MNERTTLIGVFGDQDAAKTAIERLRDAGYERDQIGFASNDPDATSSRIVEEHGNAAGPGAVGGLVTGAAAGGVIGWLGLAAIPAIGPFLAGGAIGTALIGAAAGGATGGILGGLLGLGIPRHQAEMHEEQVKQGRTLVSVQTDDVEAAESILADAGAIEAQRYAVEREAAGTAARGGREHPADR